VNLTSAKVFAWLLAAACAAIFISADSLQPGLHSRWIVEVFGHDTYVLVTRVWSLLVIVLCIWLLRGGSVYQRNIDTYLNSKRFRYEAERVEKIDERD
jgi:hypothetical protein